MIIIMFKHYIDYIKENMLVDNSNEIAIVLIGFIVFYRCFQYISYRKGLK